MPDILLKPLNEQVIVITGASSGIGLATAHMAVRAGAKVVLVARNTEALERIQAELRSMGGEVTYITGDVAAREDVQRIANCAIERFGGFDTWVNNAGLSIFGRLEEVSESDHRRLFDINFWGVVNGSIVALEHLKQQGGAIINLGSALSSATVPLQAMYAASKHAVKSFTDGLRMELQEQHAPVSVTLIRPASINTPFPQHAKNYTGREPKLPAPVYSPDEVARAILHAATHPVRDIYVGSAAKTLGLANQHAPHLFDWIGSRMLFHQQLRDELPRDPEGALHKPGNDGSIEGDHPGFVMQRSYYMHASMNPTMTRSVIAGVGFALLGFWAGRKLVQQRSGA